MNALFIAGTDVGVGKTVLKTALASYWQQHCRQQRLGTLAIAPRHNQQIDLEATWQQLEALRQQNDFVLIDTEGGLGMPLTRETTLADLAWDWRLPTVLVVPVVRGAIAHAVANAALAERAHVYLKGVVLSCVHPCQAHEREDWAAIDVIQSITQKPVLGCIPHLSDPTDRNKLVQIAANLELERLLPLVY